MPSAAANARQSGSSKPRSDRSSSWAARSNCTTQSFHSRVQVVPEHARLPEQRRIAHRVRRAAGPIRRTRPRCPRSMRSGATAAGRIDAPPAGARQPDLGPGVGMRLAHDQVAADRIPVAALVAGDDARRDPGRAHQRRECRGVVPAESLARVEQEIVDRIAREARRRQRVVELLLAEQLEHRLHVGGVARRPRARMRRASSTVRGLRPGGSCRLSVPERERRARRRRGSADTSARRSAAPH